MANMYRTGVFTVDTKHTKVESGFGLCKNEANLDASRNSINVVDNLANAWTESKQGMSKFPMNDSKMFVNYMPVNEPQLPGQYSNNTNVKAKNASEQLDKNFQYNKKLGTNAYGGS